MTNYNSGFSYNSAVNYNSATYFIVEVSNAGHGAELISLIASLSTSDSGIGVDTVGTPTEYPADSYFIITTAGRMEPLGVLVLGDSRKEQPSVKEYVDNAPGRHGELLFDTKLSSRLLELHVATDDGLTPLQKEQLKRTIARYLNPVAGTKKLIFQDDEDKAYEVKYAGKIDLTQYSDWMDFTIPFKMANPAAVSSVENTLTGNGTLTNSGNLETGMIIEISGAITDPSIVIGAYTLSYDGTISAGQTLVIDTEAMTVELDGVNVIDNFTGEMPLMLQPGNTVVTASSQVTFKWYDRWL